MDKLTTYLLLLLLASCQPNPEPTAPAAPAPTPPESRPTLSLTFDDGSTTDTLYALVPSTERAGKSLIWSLAKAAGTYEDRLRYPAEDSKYEEEKLRTLGL